MTMKVTNNKLKREVIKNPRATAAQLKAENVKKLKKVSIRTIQHRHQKDLLIPLE